MPPKAKFSKNEIIQAAIDVIELEGFDKLTARNLGEKLGSSARPIFTVFESMDEVAANAVSFANDVYCSYINRGLNEPLPFKGVGEQYIKFAAERPQLFRMLFMKENTNAPNTRGILQELDVNYTKILSSITDNYKLSAETAKKLYVHLWIYSHGIAVLTATKVCEFTSGQISEMLTEVFTGLLIKAKKGELK